MPVAKIIGLEIEFGIMVRGTRDWNPVSASSFLINAYTRRSLAGGIDGGANNGRDTRSTAAISAEFAPVGWDFSEERPGADARERHAVEFALPPEIETHLVNAVLHNGARFYVDHAHPELSAPECRTAHDALLYDKASEMIAVEAMRRANVALPEGQEIVLYKDNSDRKGNSYGCHENYLMARSVPFGEIVRAATLHFVTRQIYTGSGKVGSEIGAGVDYQLSQRAEHFEEPVGLETTLKRPIVNTRDEPHADASTYRRLHVIAGDANMAETATLLKVGTTAIVLAMVESGMTHDVAEFAHPVRAMHQVSHDLSLRQPLRLTDGTTATALELQIDLWQRAQRWGERFGFDSVGGDAVAHDLLQRWETVLRGLERDPMSVADQIDWLAKKRLLEGFMARHDCDWHDPRLRALDVQYHDLRPDKCLAARAGLTPIIEPADAQRAMTEPPRDTRAYFRGRCLAKYADSIVSANWDSIVFDVDGGPLRRVPMIEPTRGTVELVGALIDSCDTAEELIEKLGA